MTDRFFTQVNGTQGYCVYHQYMRKRLAGETQTFSFVFNTGTAYQSAPATEHFAIILDGSYHNDFYDPCQYEASGRAPLQGRGITIGNTTTCKPFPSSIMGVDFEHFGGGPSGTANVGCARNTVVDGQTNLLGGGCSTLTPVPGESYNVIISVDDSTCEYFIKDTNSFTYEYKSVAMPTVAWQDSLNTSSIMIYDVVLEGTPSEFSFCSMAAQIV